jgi:hypothetical protein
MLPRIFITFLLFLCFAGIAQTPLRHEQLAPKGLPHYPTDIHVFPDQSAIINVAQPYLYRFELLNDSTLQAFDYTLVKTDSFVTGARMEVLSNKIFTKGKYITRDGGTNWSLIKSLDFLNFWFLKPDFWIFQNAQGKIFTTSDSGLVWQSDSINYTYALGDEDYRTLIRQSDSSVFHLYSDTLMPMTKWPQRYPGKALPLYYHQVDSLRFLFEVDLQLYQYDLGKDTTFQVNDISTRNRPFINLYTPGDQFIREDNLSYVFLFADTTMQWINRSKVYNAGSYEYSDGRMWYNSFKPFTPFSLGNIAFFRPLSNQKVLWGNSDGAFITYVANTSADSIFYVPNNFINSQAELGQAHNNDYLPFNQMEYGLGIAKENSKFFETRDDGLNWQEHISTVSNLPAQFSHREYNRAVDTTCFVDVYLRNLDPRVEAKINLNKGSNSLLSQINSDGNNGEYLKEVYDIGFKNCDTGSVIIDNRLYRTKDGGVTFDSPFSGVEFYNFKRIDSLFYLSSDSGVFKSINYYDWQLIGGPTFNKPLDHIFSDSVFFNVRSGSSIEYSLDGGNSIGNLDVGSPSLFSAAGVGDSALLVSSLAGALFKIYLPWAAGPIGFDEEFIQLPQISIYPNPNSSGLIHIQSDIDLKSYQVFDLRGQEIATGTIAKNQKKLQIIKPKSGVYYLELNNDNGFRFLSKIIFN